MTALLTFADLTVAAVGIAFTVGLALGIAVGWMLRR